MRDLHGHKFESLTVQAEVPRPEGKTGRGLWWRCVCDCGKTVVLRSWAISGGFTKSCGCRRQYAALNRVCNPPKPRSPESVARRRKLRIFCTRRAAAVKNGIPFTIQFDELSDPPAFCPVLGVPLAYSNKSNDPNSPSLDRFIPEMGYVPGNVQWISMRANMLKRDGTVDEISKLATWMQAEALRPEPAPRDSVD
jgi:hypothetical protein